MKRFSLVVFLLFGTLWVQVATENDLQDVTETTNTNNDVDASFYARIKEMLDKKCKSIDVDSAAKNLSFVISETKTCLANTLPNNQDEFMTSDFYKEQCGDGRGINRDCFKDIIHIWEDCTKEEEKYFAGFFLDALDALYNYICADNGAVIIKVFNDSAWDCVLTLLDKGNPSTVCDDRLKVLKDGTPNDVVFPKEDVCEDIYTAKACYEDYISVECPKDTIFREVIVGFFDAASTPCKKRRRDLLGLPLPYSKH